MLRCYMFTSGTGLTLVCQGPLVLLYVEPRRGGGCTNHADCLCSGRTGLSPPAVYPTMPAELETNKGNLGPRHHV